MREMHVENDVNMRRWCEYDKKIRKTNC